MKLNKVTFVQHSVSDYYQSFSDISLYQNIFLSFPLGPDIARRDPKILTNSNSLIRMEKISFTFSIECQYQLGLAISKIFSKQLVIVYYAIDVNLTNH